MIDIRPILRITGALLAALGCAMFLPALIDIVYLSSDWQVFVLSGILTLLAGSCCWLMGHGANATLSVREAFLMTVIAWVALTAFGALPIFFSGVVPGFTDAFFESMSGLTTTGATVITGLEFTPPGILFWRSLQQWLGGLGIIVMAVAVLPMLQVGGMQIFKTEAFETTDKILPRASQISGSMTLVYTIFTVLCLFSYWAAGMSVFDAMLHAMTTVATGGFSSKDGSIGAFDSAGIDTIATIFMIAGSLPFLLYVQAFQGNPKPLWRDSQVRFFSGLLIILILIVWFQQHQYGVNVGLAGLQYAAFNVVSILTGTGYATADYDNWGPLMVGLFMAMMMIGGCAGSTACGIKIFRVQVVLGTMFNHAKQILSPSRVIMRRYNGRPLPEHVIAAVMSFFVLYSTTIAALTVALSLTGLDDLTAISGAISAVANVGPGLGPVIGPTGNFQSLNDPAKWLLAFGMLAGRLELLTILVLFVPRFWRG